MAPLPPPPPPAPPPPPPMGGQPGPKLSKGNAPMDRNALLSQIRGGAKLKRAAVVNDRSSPIIDGKSTSGTSAKSSSGVKPTANGPIQLGGLFAGGVPKLRSTGSKLVANEPTKSVNNTVIHSMNSGPKAGDSAVRPTNTTSTIKTSLEEKLQFHQQNSNFNGSNNNNNSFLHSKTSSVNESNGFITNKNKYHTISLSKAREKPNCISSSNFSSEGKGQAPQVPTQTLNGSAPSLPKKPSGVQRSNSQTNNRTVNNLTRRPGPPNTKPPPPPKLKNGNSAPLPPLSMLSNTNRRQSYNDDDKHDSNDDWNGRTDIASLVSNFNQQGVKPPAPPRNGNVMNGFSQSPTYPPPPPPISTIPSRSNSSTVRLPQVNKTAPNIPIQPSRVQSNVRPPLGPPPPPPHRTTSNAAQYPAAPPPPPPPSQTKVIPTAFRNGVSPGPPPPVRNTSISRDEFASRFQTFKNIYELPAPTTMNIANKAYPSQMQQSQRRRDPPPPPPQSNGLMAHNSPNFNAHNNSNNAKKFSSSNPMLHIQIGSSLAQQS